MPRQICDAQGRRKLRGTWRGENRIQSFEVVVVVVFFLVFPCGSGRGRGWWPWRGSGSESLCLYPGQLIASIFLGLPVFRVLRALLFAFLSLSFPYVTSPLSLRPCVLGTTGPVECGSQAIRPRWEGREKE